MMVQHPVSSLSNGARTFLIQHRFRGAERGQETPLSARFPLEKVLDAIARSPLQ